MVTCPPLEFYYFVEKICLGFQVSATGYVEDPNIPGNYNLNPMHGMTS